MLKFDYLIKDENGIHARPAGLLVKEASKYNSEINIELKDKMANAKKIFSLMSLGIKKNDLITITVNGTDEATAFEALKIFMHQNL